MKSALLLSSLALTRAYTIPAVSKRDSSSSSASSNPYANITDPDILNYALTLEHLESAFYTQGLQNFSKDAFAKAGFAPAVRANYEQIRSHEQTHVQFLQAALQSVGAPAVNACQYDFSASWDVPSFISMSAALETIGDSAYSGAANLVTNKAFLQAAATILSTEARHSTWIQGNPLHTNPWSGPFEVPLSPNQVITIASNFLVSCPSTNPPLAAQPFPALNLPSSAAPGANVEVSYNTSEASGDVSNLSAAFMTSNGTIFAPLTAGSSSGTFNVTFPCKEKLLGTVFVLIVNNDTTAVTDATTVAGPAPIMFPFNATDPAVENLFNSQW